MLKINKFAAALAVIGSGAVISACAGSQANSPATEVPSGEGQGAKASCSANGACGAAKETSGEAAAAAKPAEETAAAAPQAEAQPTKAGAEAAPATNAAAAPAPATTTTAAKATPTTTTPTGTKKIAGDKKKKKDAGAACGEGGCG